MVDLAPAGPGDGEPEPAPTPAARLLLDAFDRIASVVGAVLDGLEDDRLARRPAPGANTIGWLVWHLTRIQDDHLAAAFGHPQVWIHDRWAERFALPFEPTDTGYGHAPGDVDALRASGSLLLEYHRAVHERSRRDLGRVTDFDLERIVDERFDPPVTLAVRLVSVVADDLEHAGQAAYARGMLERADRG